jgi:hypothetical protein
MSEATSAPAPAAAPAPSPAPAAAPAPSPAPAASPSPAPASAAKGNPLLDAPLEDIPDAWREHARELRRENAKYRELAKQADEEAQQKKIDAALKEAADKQKQETEALLKKEREASNKRIVSAEVRAAATAQGIQDLDALKLLDTSKITVNEETGEASGVKELIDEFKKAKPYLFKEPTVDTTQTRRPPAAEGGTKKFDASTATKEELAADAKSRGLKLRTH